ncbi:hypothetical protein BDV09DRAFT_189693 [Aspergillus tetrazonus]
MYLIFLDIATARLLPSHPQAIGVTGAAWLSGNIALFSMNNPPVAAITAASFVYLAVLSSLRSSPPILFRAAPYSRAGFYASAALLTLGIVPFTLVAMSSTNNALIAGQRGSVAATDARIEGLLQDWVALNRVRSLLPLLGSLTGIAVALL